MLIFIIECHLMMMMMMMMLHDKLLTLLLMPLQVDIIVGR